MATKTIGTGGDYTSYALYLTYLQTLGTLSAPEIGRQKNEELTVAAGITFTGFTPTSSNQWTLEAEPGAGFRDHADKLTNALRYNAANGAGIKSTSNYNTTITISVPWATIRNLQLLNAGTNATSIVNTGNFGGAGNVTLDWLICQANDFDSFAIRFQGSADKIRNSLVICNEDATINSNAPIQFRNGGSAHFCTFVRPSNRTAGGNMVQGNYAAGTVNNCVWSGFSNTAAGAGATGSNNATDQASFPAGISGQTSLTATTEFEQPSNSGGAMDFRLKSTSVKCKDNGSTDSVNGATDIVGTARPSGAAYDIGCWEFASGGGGPAAFANPLALLGVGRSI